MTDDTRTSAGTGLVVFTLGAAAGAIAALLLAPRNGSETRTLIAETAKGAKDLASRVPAAVSEATGAARSAFGEAMNG